MKAPEKIYLYPYSTDGIYEVETKPLEGTVEYYHTDAFIEKACEWLKKNVTYIHPRKGTEECIVNLVKFKEAMKL